MTQFKNQANTLRRLSTILKEAIKNGNKGESIGTVLLKAMDLERRPGNLVEFFEILNKAEYDARRIKKIEDIDIYIKALEDLKDLFIATPVWSLNWGEMASKINNANLVIPVISLASYFDIENPTKILDEEFLKELNDKFQSFINEVDNSEFSGDFRIFITNKIEDILIAVNRYKIDGTEGLEKAAKLFVYDLVVREFNLKEEDKKNALFQKIKAAGMALVLYIVPKPYGTISVVPDINQYWVPQIQKFLEGSEQIEKIIYDEPNMSEVFKKISNIFSPD
jgi:hypothetical protein